MKERISNAHAWSVRIVTLMCCVFVYKNVGLLFFRSQDRLGFSDQDRDIYNRWMGGEEIDSTTLAQFWNKWPNARGALKISLEDMVDILGVSTDRIVKKNPVRDIAFFNALNWTWNVQLLSDKALDRIDSFVTEPYIKELIYEKNDRLIAIAKRAEKLKLDSFPITPEMRDADSIFTAIVSPHRGKVVYMDIWGVWCAPCRDEMEHVPSIKKALADKDVVFIYLANRTSQEQLRTFIADKELTGDNVVHYNLPEAQQSAFESKYINRGFPTYILVDKTGKMLTNDAPHPSSGKILIDKINELLLAE